VAAGNELIRYLRRSLELPPTVVLAKGRRRIAAAWRQQRARLRDARRSTYLSRPPAGGVRRVFTLPDAQSVAPHAKTLSALVRQYLEHRFDLLGSGWVRVGYGLQCSGLEGHVFAHGPVITSDPEGRWLEELLPAPCLAEAQRIWQLVSPGYAPIDWQMDFKSGFRWSTRTWYRDVRVYGNPLGADIKLPWELARGQHLPQLALAFAVWQDVARKPDRNRLFDEFRNEVLDFVSANPPRFGVNWACTMDVAIRVANWIAAYDIFCAAGVAPDADFAAVFSRSVQEHALHIIENLEWTEGLRGNHYLANVCGLLIATAALPSAPQPDAWLAFAVQELGRETALQFNEEGSNVEASTCYHRLTGEMVIYATAAALGLPEERVRGLQELGRLRFPSGGVLDGALPCVQGDRIHFDEAHGERVYRMAAFVRDITRPDGRAPQIGDNDSGRFLKLPGTYGYDAAGLPQEDALDHRHFIAAAGGLFAEPETHPAAERRVDWAIVRGLARGRVLPTGGWRCGLQSSKSASEALRRNRDTVRAIASPRARHYAFIAEGGRLREGLQVFAYDQFGLYVARSRRLYLAFRCGRLHPGSAGGHAHNDQLSIELIIDGQVLIVDPGTFLYTPFPEARNRYRSVAAHFAPRVEGMEPGELSHGLFVLADRARATCTYAGVEGFSGEHQGFGAAVVRVVSILDDRIEIDDASFGLPLVDLTRTTRPPESQAYGRVTG